MAWERLAHTELSSAGDDIDTGTFTAKQSLRVLVHIQDSGTCNVKMRFNGFADQSYSTKYGESGANDGSSTSATFVRCYEVGSGTDVQRQMTFEITNISDKEKHILGHTVESESTGASTIPKRVELAGKFDKTNQQITRIQLVNDASGSFGAGSYITVLGAKEPATADSITVDGGEDNTVTLSDDFSSDNFTNVGGQSGWGVSGGTMAWTTHRSTTHQGEYRALPSTVTGDFVLRFKLTNTTIAYDSSQEEYLYIGLSNSNSCASNTNQNVAGMYFHNYSSSDSKIQVTYRTNTSPFSGTATSIDFGENTTYYVEISKSDDTVTLKLFSDEDYSTLMSGGSASSTSGGASDQYTHIVLMGMYHSNAGSTSALGTIDDIKFYNGVSQVRKGFTAKKNLKVQLFAEGTGGTINCNMTFNNNTDQAYAIRESVNGGTDTTNINLTNTDNLTGTVTGSIYADVDITNISDKEKLFISEGMESVSGSGSAPERKEMVGKWVKTDQQITTIKANNGGTGSYKEGSQLIVWGSDGASDTTYPTLVGGYIFEESDTGKHFMYDGTNTWTEIS